MRGERPAPTLVPRGFIPAFAIALVLIVARSVVYLFNEHAFFDSDQAIVGLMAKHLAEGRAFPLFYYGQAYMLAVDAWVAAPFFLAFGATVGVLHLSVMATNVAAAALLIWGLLRYTPLGPAQVAIATLFFTFAPPLTAASLIEAGANIGVFLYVPLLWFCRDRPIPFGVVLAIGFLNREFTVYALPPLAIAELVQRRLDGPRLRHWLLALVVTLGTWQAVQALKHHADLMGPGTRGQLIVGMAESQVGNIAKRVRVSLDEYPSRAAVMVGQHLPRLWGMAKVDSPIASQGHEWLAWVTGSILVLAVGRATWLGLRRGPSSVAFGWYLFGVGATAALGYIVARPVGPVVDRYILLTLFLPIGASAVALASEPRRLWRGVIAAAVLVWAAGSAADHAHLASRYWPEPPPDDVRRVVDLLLDRGVTVAEAGYWRAYKLSFVSGERLVVASTDVERIHEYRARARREGPGLLEIREQPCTSGEPLGPWFLCTTP